MHPVTRRNIESAMRDEAFMCARFTLYGRNARAHGHRELADLFESLADVEVFDYFMKEADLARFASRSDVENLRDAMAAEAAAGEETYRALEHQARVVGETEAAAEFERIRADKRRRHDVLAQALERLDQSMPHTHRILVVADESCHGSGLCDEISYRAGRVPTDVLIVAPALTRSRLHYLASDLDRERGEADDRMRELRAQLAGNGVQASGRVGDANPIVAVEDALREFPADEIVIATRPPEESPWLERRLVDQARERFAPLLITHVVVDPALDHGMVTAAE